MSKAAERVTVACTFWDPNQRRIVVHEIKVDTTLGPKMLAIRHACQEFARAKGFPGWAQPAGVEDSARWLVFNASSGTAHFVRAFPNKEAAEMMVLHQHCG